MSGTLDPKIRAAADIRNKELCTWQRKTFSSQRAAPQAPPHLRILSTLRKARCGRLSARDLHLSREIAKIPLSEPPPVSLRYSPRLSDLGCHKIASSLLVLMPPCLQLEPCPRYRHQPGLQPLSRTPMASVNPFELSSLLSSSLNLRCNGLGVGIHRVQSRRHNGRG